MKEKDEKEYSGKAASLDLSSIISKNPFPKDLDNLLLYPKLQIVDVIIFFFPLQFAIYFILKAIIFLRGNTSTAF